MSRIDYLTRIHFGDYILSDAIGIEITGYGLRRPLIVTEASVVESGLMDHLLDVWPTSIPPYIIPDYHDGLADNLSSSGTEHFREHDCDGVIGFGGNRAIDLAKVIALLASHDQPLSHFLVTEGGSGRIRDILPPVFAIPTSAGTGAEVSHSATLTASNGQRQTVISDHIIPRVAICDPTLTTGVSPQLTAESGMDALTQCVETYLALSFNPPADGIAIEGLQRVAGSIEKAVKTGTDLAARRELMAASINGALALQKGLGSVQALSNALEASSQVSAGAGAMKSVLLPTVLAFNAPAVSHRYNALKAAIGIPDHTDISEGLNELSGRVGLPVSLGALGVGQQDVARAAIFATLDHNSRTNPRRATIADYESMIYSVL